MDLTVVICSHNPKRHYLEKVLQGLRKQTLSTDLWELLLVDNASQEPLEAFVDTHWHPHFRIIRENELGLTPARLRGIRESQGKLLIFVDDDNVLESDYLDTTKRICRDFQFIGAWSGQCHPGFDSPPPEWTKRYWGMLVIREFAKDCWSNLGHLTETMPCGAGMCVRRTVAEEYLRLHDSGQRSTMLDRRGTSLMSAGDNDLAACACDIGLGVGLFHSLELTHLIPENRLTEEYLTRLSNGIYYSSIYLQSLRGNLPPQTSWAKRVLQRLQGLKMSPRDRRIFGACCRGRDQALAELGQKKIPRSLQQSHIK